MSIEEDRYIRVASLAELEKSGSHTLSCQGRTVVVFYHAGSIYAVDNRCPHMGFPLDRGSICDGILTCHWHHARFDLSSGGTFDAFADDVATFPVLIKDDDVWLDPIPEPRDEVNHWSRRLNDGLEHNISLVIAKAVLGLQAARNDYRIALTIGIHFGLHYSVQGWGPAMSILTCCANILPKLSEVDRPLAIYHGLQHVARECAGKAPRFPVEPLPSGIIGQKNAIQWFRYFIDVRDTEGAERCLRTAIECDLPKQLIADMLYAAATDHIYLDDGHLLDYTNKAFELLDHVGWELAGSVLTSLVPGMAEARRSEELNAWRHPVDIASLLLQTRDELPSLYKKGQRAICTWKDKERLTLLLLGDDPEVIINTLKDTIQSGAAPEALSSALSYAAFLRVAHFSTANEFGDWDTVHNTLTAANALHQALTRTPSVELMRGLFDCAMRIYLDRFLNIPAKQFPTIETSNQDEKDLLQDILNSTDRQQNTEGLSRLISTFMSSYANQNSLLAMLGKIMLREDAEFHSFQIVEAAFQQYQIHHEKEIRRHLLIAIGRFLAAHSPTPRTTVQTYQIALRLHHGEDIYRSNL